VLEDAFATFIQIIIIGQGLKQGQGQGQIVENKFSNLIVLY
jgi:hypothetical protein